MEDRKWNLFIGRWSPFHKGHQCIIDSFVNNGKPVCVAIRETPISESDPYTVEQRVEMIKAVYKDNPLVKVISIPDIEMICVGRGVGYALVEAPEEIQQISATGIRQGTCDAISEEVKEIIK